MELSKLELDLRPRPNGQALDLGFALLRSHAKDVYLAWLFLLLPLTAVCGILACLFPAYYIPLLAVPWWLKPLLERAPLYVLSRQVFGEPVTWKDALRAWPKQLKGGWFRLLTWWRFLILARGLYQPIWQLEGARGEVAAERRRTIGKNGTARSASWFGVACAHFEGFLQVGLMVFISLFLAQENAINPFTLFDAMGKTENVTFNIATAFFCFAVGAGIIGPIYVACCFTLYLNRRATLEAWDIEIILRQITPPTAKKHRTTTLLSMLLPAVITLALWSPTPADAAATATKKEPPVSSEIENCDPPSFVKDRLATRNDDADAQQTRLRNEVVDLFNEEDLRGYTCKEVWKSKIKAKEKEKPKVEPKPKLWHYLGALAQLIKILLIAALICFVAWLLYRYREKFGLFTQSSNWRRATLVGGVDIRPETLPDDVAEAVRQLWLSGAHREALALLYRSTLSRLVNREGIALARGDTEGDCLRRATQAHARQKLSTDKLAVVTAAIRLWLDGAYAKRWPTSDIVMAHCAAWDAQFGVSNVRGERL